MRAHLQRPQPGLRCCFRAVMPRVRPPQSQRKATKRNGHCGCFLDVIQAAPCSGDEAYIQAFLYAPKGARDWVSYRDPVLYSHAPRLIVLYGEIGTRKPQQRRMRKGCLCAAPAHVHSAHAASCCWSTACSPHPARPADWPHGSFLAPASCFSGNNSRLDLT